MSQIIRELRGKKDTHNTNSPQRDDAYAMAQEEYCRTVRSSVEVRKVKTIIRCRDEVKAPNQDLWTTKPERRQEVAAILK